MVTIVNMTAPRWVLLSSRVPREPTRLRLAVWRRLRRLGALLLHDAVWVLPADSRTREAFEWLADEIVERGGTALVWAAESLDRTQDLELMRRFRDEADERYQAIADSAEGIGRAVRRRGTGASRLIGQARRQLGGLERAIRLERRRDYFRSPVLARAVDGVNSARRRIEERQPNRESGGAKRAMGD
jgi:hypothetical protein